MLFEEAAWQAQHLGPATQAFWTATGILDKLHWKNVHLSLPEAVWTDSVASQASGQPLRALSRGF
jgi:hypothetical protein